MHCGDGHGNSDRTRGTRPIRATVQGQLDFRQCGPNLSNFLEPEFNLKGYRGKFEDWLELMHCGDEVRETPKPQKQDAPQ